MNESSVEIFPRDLAGARGADLPSGARPGRDAYGFPPRGPGDRSGRSAGSGVSAGETNETGPAPHAGHEAVVVGMGAFSPLGRNCAEMRRALLDGRDSIAKVTHIDAGRFIGELASSFGEDVPVEMDADARSWVDRATLLTIEACREAMHHAGVNLGDLDPERIGCPVHLRAPRPGRGCPPTLQRLAKQEDGGCAGPLLLLVRHALWGLLCRRSRGPCCAHQLYRLLVHADHRLVRIIAARIGLQQFLHRRHECRVCKRSSRPWN